MIRICPKCKSDMELVYIHREIRGGSVETLYMYRCRRCGLEMEEKHIYEPEQIKWTTWTHSIARTY